MKKIYKNLPIAPGQKRKRITAAQLRAHLEQLIIKGGYVRASKMPRTAHILNRGRGARVLILAVPLIDERQLQFLQAIADEGIIGQTPEEVGAWFIRDGLHDRLMKGKCKCS